MEHLGGRHFLQIPGPTNVPDRVLRAMAAPTIDHRGPEFRRACQAGACRRREALRQRTAGGHLPVVRPRGVGSRARQHPVARRYCPRLRRRPFRRALARAGAAAWIAGRSAARRLAARCAARTSRRQAGSRPRAPDQGRHGRAQRDIHRRDQRIPLIRAAIDSAGHPALLPTCCSGCAKLSPSSASAGCPLSSPGTPGTRRPLAERCGPGGLRSGARILRRLARVASPGPA